MFFFCNIQHNLIVAGYKKLDNMCCGSQEMKIVWENIFFTNFFSSFYFHIIMMKIA